jgi:hypothetical protein
MEIGFWHIFYSWNTVTSWKIDIFVQDSLLIEDSAENSYTYVDCITKEKQKRTCLNYHIWLYFQICKI